MTVFDIFADILTKKSKCTLHKEWQFKVGMSNFMIARLLRMKPGLHQFANVANRYQSIWSKEDMYLWLYNNVPHIKNGYVLYIAKKKKPEDKKSGKITKDEDGYLIF